ncbi:hypothetical protein [Chitinimonas lacunae]|uniref:SWIM-type domain-containing protein n=1 Tax=Chitinimonas lacunae TaxID=1963018 RepID=A0ABV8MPA2_9NEIS
MSALLNWLAHLDDEAIVAWSNRGLLRRGAKLLEGAAGAGWQLDAQGGAAELDGLHQRLVGIGFSGLHCSCPALGPCHHLTALLLGLRERAANSQPTVAADPEAPPPWLLDAAAREKLFGRRLLRIALRWLARGEVDECESGPDGLRLCMTEPEAATVHIPRIGGLEASLCDCRAPSPCAHRALAVLAASQEAGLVAREELAAVESLDEVARAAVDDAQSWLRALLAQGGGSVGAGFVAQGEALATALRQADLPLPAGRMSRVIATLDALRGRRASGGVELRAALAPLWAGLNALSSQPLPRPLLELAGVHRRRYSRQPKLTAQGVALEAWRSPAGHRGLTLHLLDLDNHRFYRISEARPPAVDPDWQPETAFPAFRPGGRSVSLWCEAQWALSPVWTAGDRLSLRDDSRIVELGPARTLDELAETDFSRAAASVRQRQAADPFVPAEPSVALLRVAQWQAPRFDPYRRRWQRVGVDGEGLALTVELAGKEGVETVLHHLQDAATLFGYLTIEQGRLTLRLIAASAGGRWAGAERPL